MNQPPLYPVLHSKAVVRIMLLLGVGGLLFFFNIIEDVVTGDSGTYDRLLLRRAHRLALSPDGDWLTPLAKGFSIIGNWQVIIPLGLLLALLAWRRRTAWRAFYFYAIACVGSGLLTLTFKFVVNRPRPQIVPALEEAPFASFPSGHSVYALVAYGFVAYLVARRSEVAVWLKILAALAALGLALLVGASRVYLAAHYPSDVAAGWLIGVPWLMAILFLFEYFRRPTK